MTQQTQLASVPWILRPRNRRTLRVAWTLGGAVVGLALMGVAEALLHRHIPVSLGAIGGLIVGSVEGHLITRKIDNGFDVKHPSTSPPQTAKLRTSAENLGQHAAGLAGRGATHDPRDRPPRRSDPPHISQASHCGHHLRSDNRRNA